MHLLAVTQRIVFDAFAFTTPQQISASSRWLEQQKMQNPENHAIITKRRRAQKGPLRENR